MDSEYDWNELEREIDSKLQISDIDPDTQVSYVQAYLYEVRGDFATGEVHGETHGPYGDGGDISFNFVYNWRTKQFV